MEDHVRMKEDLIPTIDKFIRTMEWKRVVEKGQARMTRI
jgi:hypothetical protein